MSKEPEINLGPPAKNNSARPLPAVPSPGVFSRTLFVSLSGRPADWLSALSDLGFTSAKLSGGALELELAQSSSLSGDAHQFVRLRISKSETVLSYSCSPGQNPVARKRSAARLALLALAATNASPISSSLGSFLGECLEDAQAGSFPMPSHPASAGSDERARKLEGQLGLQSAKAERDARQMLSDAQTIQSLRLQLERLLSLSERALDEETMEWLRAHDGLVSVRELARHLDVPPSRIEASLERLCRAGYVSLVKE